MLRQDFRLISMLAILSLFSIAKAGATTDDDAHDRFKAAFQSCASELGLPAPQPGQHPPKLSDEQRSDLDTCLAKQGVPPPQGGPHGPGGPGGHDHAAMHACLDASGVAMPPPPIPGAERPVLSDAQKAALDACRAKVQNSAAQDQN